jgi:DNA-directed RNA polymerase subunit RPC12/RpoP
MKLKCTKCGKIVSKKKEIFEDQVQFLGITPEEYKMFYLCRCCRREYPMFDWSSISVHPNLLQHPDFIEKYKDKLRWWKICEEQQLPEWFIEKYEQYVDWLEVYQHQKLSEQFIEKRIPDLDEAAWSRILMYQKLSIEFIERHIERINKSSHNRTILSGYQQLPEWFIEKYSDKVNWFSISLFQQLTPEFIAKHIDKINESILLNRKVMDTLPDSLKLLLKQKFNK